MDRLSVYSSNPEEIKVFCLPILQRLENIRSKEQNDFEMVNQAEELIVIA